MHVYLVINFCCSSLSRFVIELCEPIQVKQLDIANFELFSSTPKDFLVSISDRYTPFASFMFKLAINFNQHSNRLACSQRHSVRLRQAKSPALGCVCAAPPRLFLAVITSALSPAFEKQFSKWKRFSFLHAPALFIDKQPVIIIFISLNYTLTWVSMLSIIVV